MNYYINLENGQGYFEEEEEEEYEISTYVLCGCGKHVIDSREDVYKQHNEWIDSFSKKVESSDSRLQNVKGVVSTRPKKIKLSYDFSGDEFEVDPSEIRKVKNGHR